MAGGTWTSQNKAQPGVYINTKSQGNIRANIGTRGNVGSQNLFPGDRQGLYRRLSQERI